MQNLKFDFNTNELLPNVFSKNRTISTPLFDAPCGMKFNSRLKMDGLNFLSKLSSDTIPVAFFDPQYRGVLDKMGYGNEGVKRGKERCSLKQMTESIIHNFVQEISRVLIPTGHLFLWMDKFHLCTGFSKWLDGTNMDVVDMLVWYKRKIGMGYRSRRTSEYLVVLQKQPRRAKGVWKIHNIPDVWHEEVKRNGHTHKKPVMMQAELIEAVTNKGDVVIDPAAGSFSVLEACIKKSRNFLGCDLNG